MPNIQDTIKLLHSPKIKDVFSELYGEEKAMIKKQVKRYEQIVEKHDECFGNGDIQLFSTPGRTEIGGNHTDHNAGVVLAASVNLDSVAVSSVTDNPCITVYSEGYSEHFQVDLNDLGVKKEEEGTTSAMIRGIAARFKSLGYLVGGFNACISSEVRIGSGLSSSASIEVLLATILNTLFNQGKIPEEAIAMIGKYAENEYFNKPCGLMDQLTCAVGGIVFIDFRHMSNPIVKRIHFDFNEQDYRLLVIDTGGSHADLTQEYASVSKEMHRVAQALGGKVLRDVEFSGVLNNIDKLRLQVGDRAILRACHFFMDNQRVFELVEALEQSNFDSFLHLVNESGNSSFKWLQNCYLEKNPSEQGIPLALLLTQNYLKSAGNGACRVHGGGFAGTIQVFMPYELLDAYVKMMESVFGEGSVLMLSFRPYGTLHLNSLL